MPMGDAAAALVDLADLGLDEGGHLLVARALARLPPGGRLTVTGRHPALRIHLAQECGNIGAVAAVHGAGAEISGVWD